MTNNHNQNKVGSRDAEDAAAPDPTRDQAPTADALHDVLRARGLPAAHQGGDEPAGEHAADPDNRLVGRGDLPALPDLERGLSRPELSPAPLTGSVSLWDALRNTYVDHISYVEVDNPHPFRPYTWCGCGWRSDDLLGNDTWERAENPGAAYANHLAQALHDAAIKVLRSIAVRVPSRVALPTDRTDDQFIRDTYAAARAQVSDLSVEAASQEFDDWVKARAARLAVGA